MNTCSHELRDREKAKHCHLISVLVIYDGYYSDFETSYINMKSLLTFSANADNRERALLIGLRGEFSFDRHVTDRFAAV